MNLALIFILSFCALQCYSWNNLSKYFQAKHVITNKKVRKQLLSPTRSNSQKERILEDYVRQPFEAQPNPRNNPSRNSWRAALGARTASTFILASPSVISKAVRKGNPDGFDTNQRPVTKTRRNFTMMKAKIKYVNPPPGQMGPTNIRVSLVNDEEPTLRNGPLRVSYNHEGRINHFESANKIAGRERGTG